MASEEIKDAMDLVREGGIESINSASLKRQIKDILQGEDRFEHYELEQVAAALRAVAGNKLVDAGVRDHAERIVAGMIQASEWLRMDLAPRQVGTSPQTIL